MMSMINSRVHAIFLRLKDTIPIFVDCRFRLSEGLKSMSEFSGGLGSYRPPYA